MCAWRYTPRIPPMAPSTAATHRTPKPHHARGLTPLDLARTRRTRCDTGNARGVPGSRILAACRWGAHAQWAWPARLSWPRAWFGGAVSVAAGVNEWSTAWTDEATLAAPWPMLLVQAGATARGGPGSALASQDRLGCADLECRPEWSFRVLRWATRPARPWSGICRGPGRLCRRRRGRRGCRHRSAVSDAAARWMNR